MSLLPEILNIVFEEITDHTALLSWETNIPTQVLVEFTNVLTNETKSQGDLSFLRERIFEITELEPNVPYALTITVTDEWGQEATSPILSFYTGIDIEPPKITEVRVDTALTPLGDRVQTIISWRTNEPATSQVFYQEGVVKRPELIISTPKDEFLKTRHIVIIPDFKPGTIYRFYVESADAAGNLSASRHFTVLTPQRRRTIFEIIIENFVQQFEWLRGIR